MLPHLKTAGGWFHLNGLLLLALTVLLGGCATLREGEVMLSHQLFTPEVETELGTNFAEEIEESHDILRDPMAQAWLDRVGHLLAEHSPPTPQEFRFALVESKEVNAFAIPGGFCYVNLGLLLYCDNEAQVAAVIGHEINHVTRRHGLLRLQRMMGLDMAAQLAGSASGSEVVSMAAQTAAQGGGLLAIQRFSRDDEREADELGVRAMYDAGYDPREGVRFFEKLAALHESRTPGYLESLLSTHPATSDRIQRLNALIAPLDLEGRELISDTEEFQRVKAHLAGIYGGTEPGGSAGTPGE